eukprot:Nitzschia sp. Nitz4//scaffold78_size91513//84280//84837//NITZ4_004941-RA/size91513-processed-gene-0.97-mRNA-1//-1//CDS//3329558166//4207//frame0
MTTTTSTSKPSKPKKEVVVVSCPSGFPISKASLSRKRPRDAQTSATATATTTPSKPTPSSHKSKLLDWQEVTQEIRKYGATAFEGKQKKNYQEEEYFKLTGRQKKKEKMPLPMMRGLKKAAAKRDAKVREEARQAGVILPKSDAASNAKAKSRDATYRSYGPAPNIGFMKDGIYRAKNTSKKSKR